MSDNLELWNRVEKTDPEHTKEIRSGGRKMTSISAQFQIKNATTEWGKYGESWGLKDIKLDYISNLCNNQILCVSNAVFYYVGGEFEIGSSILVQSWYANKQYNNVDEDFLKKLETDMTTKALSKLGFNADVFMGYYDDNKYVAKLKEEKQQMEHETLIDSSKEEMIKCNSLDGLATLWKSYPDWLQKETEYLKNELKEKLNK